MPSPFYIHSIKLIQYAPSRDEFNNSLGYVILQSNNCYSGGLGRLLREGVTWTMITTMTITTVKIINVELAMESYFYSGGLGRLWQQGVTLTMVRTMMITRVST